MPKLYNVAVEKPPLEAIYIGRPSKYGNPFLIGIDGTRSEVVEKYRKYLLSNESLCEEFKRELAGKDLYCYCAPKKCHGDILIRIANENTLW